jgi:hypothetical protein
VEHDPDTALDDARNRDDLAFLKRQCIRALEKTGPDDEGTLEHTLLLGTMALASGLLYISDMLYDLREIADAALGKQGTDVTSLSSRRRPDDPA